MSPTFRSLAHRDYRLYAAGAFVSNIGTWMQRVAQDWLVLEVTDGSAVALGVTTGLQFLPILLFSAYAGAIADRVPKRTLLMVSQVALAVPAAVLGLLAVTGVAQAWHVYLLAFLFGTAWAVEAPGRQAIVSELVTAEDVPNAVGLNSASFNAGRIIGPAVAGVTIAALGSGVMGTGVVILANAASYLAVLVALTRLRPRALEDRKGRRPGTVRDAVAYLRGRPDLLLVLGVMFFTGTFGLNFQMTSALMATQVFGKGAGEFGLLGTTMAVGSITGSLLAARRGSSSVRLVVVAAVVFGAVEIGFGLMPSYLMFMVLTPLVGITAMTTVTAANTVVQLTVPDRLRGRVMALYLTVFMGGTPLGAPVIGWLAEVLGPRWSLIGGGLGTIAGTLLCLVVLTARWGREALYNPGGEPPLPAPGHHRHPAAADPHRGGQPAGQWVAPPSSSPSGPRSSTAPPSSAPWRPDDDEVPVTTPAGAASS